MKILVINPGSTSTKIAVYEEEQPVYTQTIQHEAAELAPFAHVSDQLDYRLGMIRTALDKAGIRLSDLDAVSARGGFTKPVQAGTYRADGDVVKLTPTETRIVDLLIRNPGRVFPAEEIYRRVWNEEAFSCENTVMVHIRRIREKIELNPKEPDYIKVVWGIGYKMEQHG